MTRFEKDLKDALAGNEIEILTRRKAEIDKLTAEGKACKNAFRRTCIAQEAAGFSGPPTTSTRHMRQLPAIERRS